MAVRKESYISRQHYSKNREIQEWCKATLSNKVNTMNIFGHMSYIFHNDYDFTLFALTWYEYIDVVTPCDI